MKLYFYTVVMGSGKSKLEISFITVLKEKTCATKGKI